MKKLFLFSLAVMLTTIYCPCDGAMAQGFDGAAGVAGGVGSGDSVGINAGLGNDTYGSGNSGYDYNDVGTGNSGMDGAGDNYNYGNDYSGTYGPDSSVYGTDDSFYDDNNGYYDSYYTNDWYRNDSSFDNWYTQ